MSTNVLQSEDMSRPQVVPLMITSRLNFFSDPKDGTIPYLLVPDDATYSKNFEDDWKEVSITNVRGIEKTFSLECDGFEAISKVPSLISTFEHDEYIQSVYYKEVERLLFHVLPDIKQVRIFDHTIRRSRPNCTRTPVMRVHTDQTLRSARWRVRLHNPDEADTLLNGRFRIINVWRSINGTVEEKPLAFASLKTVRDDDIVTVEHRSPRRIGETVGVRYNCEQRWFYWSSMSNEEVILLQCFDSDHANGTNSGTPHSAFNDPNSSVNANPRESIEVRALVYG